MRVSSANVPAAGLSSAVAARLSRLVCRPQHRCCPLDLCPPVEPSYEKTKRGCLQRCAEGQGEPEPKHPASTQQHQASTQCVKTHAPIHSTHSGFQQHPEGSRPLILAPHSPHLPLEAQEPRERQTHSPIAANVHHGACRLTAGGTQHRRQHCHHPVAWHPFTRANSGSNKQQQALLVGAAGTLGMGHRQIPPPTPHTS